MRILVDAHVLDDKHQGTRTYIKGLYGEVIRLMPEVTFYFASYDIANLKSEVEPLPNVRFLQLRQGKFLRLLLEIPHLIRKHKIDYAHFQYITPPIKNCKHIVTTHDILFKDFEAFFPLKYRVAWDILFRISARRANLLFTVSDYSRERISFHYKIPREKIGITPNGVRVRKTREAVDPEPDIKVRYGADKFILYVSRVEPRKNHLLLLRAFVDLKLWEQAYQLILVGKKDFLFHEIDAFLQRCPAECTRNILFLENINDTDLVSFYERARLFVYPSLAEGFGIPPIEALSAGTPTLCSNATAMSDFAFLGNDLFDPQNLEELKTKITAKLSQPLDAEHVNSLRKIVNEKYSWQRSALAFVSALRESENANHERN